jgi:hypothetical protein
MTLLIKEALLAIEQAQDIPRSLVEAHRWTQKRRGQAQCSYSTGLAVAEWLQ